MDVKVKVKNVEAGMHANKVLWRNMVLLEFKV